MLSVDDALQTVLRVAQRLEPVTVSLQGAVGLVLAEDVHAPDPLPPYRASVKVNRKSSSSTFFNVLSLTIAW